MAPRAVLRYSRLAEDAGTVVTLGGDAIAVFRIGGNVLAYRNVCPHRGGPAGEGLVTGAIVTCPWHGRRFDLVTAGCVNDQAVGPLTPVTVRVVGDDVIVGG